MVGKRIKFDYGNKYIVEGVLFRYGDEITADQDQLFPKACRCSFSNNLPSKDVLTLYNTDICRKDSIKDKINLYCCKLPDIEITSIPKEIEFN